MIDPIAALRPIFVERCRSDLRELRRLRDAADTDLLSMIAHRLAGAAGSFGFPEISVAALVIDQQIRDGLRVTGPDMERLIELLAVITDGARAEVPAEGSSSEPG